MCRCVLAFSIARCIKHCICCTVSYTLVPELFFIFLLLAKRRARVAVSGLVFTTSRLSHAEKKRREKSRNTSGIWVCLIMINEIGRSRRRAGDVMSCTSMCVGSEKSVRRGSLCNENKEHFLHLFLWQGKAPGTGGGPYHDIRGGKENAARHRWEERRMLLLLEMT